MPVVQINPDTMLEKDEPYVQILLQAGFEIRYPRNPQLARGLCSDAELIEELQGVSATIASAELYTEHVIRSLPDLRVIARSGVGYDRVDVDAATRHKVLLTITPTANHEAVAEHALRYRHTTFDIFHGQHGAAGGDHTYEWQFHKGLG